jgi:hypothetical protein
MSVHKLLFTRPLIKKANIPKARTPAVGFAVLFFLGKKIDYQLFKDERQIRGAFFEISGGPACTRGGSWAGPIWEDRATQKSDQGGGQHRVCCAWSSFAKKSHKQLPNFKIGFSTFDGFSQKQPGIWGFCA